MKIRYILPLLLLCAAVAAQENILPQENTQVVAADAGGNSYTVTGRYNNYNTFLHITKMDLNGYLMWDTDYNNGSNQVPVSAAAGNDALVILALQKMNGYKTFALIAYSFNNYLLWNRLYDDGMNNIPVSMAIDKDGAIYVCGQVRTGNQYRAKLWKYASNGAYIWSATYDGVGNSYAQQLQMLFNGNVALGVQVFTGTTGAGQYQQVMVMYDTNGSRLYQ